MNSHIIVYHSNCMDGLGSAFIANKAINNLKDKEDTINLLPLYYQNEYKLFNLIKDLRKTTETNTIYVTMVDFNFKRPEMVRLLNLKNVQVVVIDHHATANEELSHMDKPNFELNFNNDKSGAVLTYEYFKDHHQLKKDLFLYIQDRDLWHWKLPNSKEISACLNWETERNNLESFEYWYSYYTELKSHEYDEMLTRGQSYLALKEIEVDRKKMNATKVQINGKDIMMINASEDISELGHAMCKEYNLPSCMFFFTNEFKVVLSFRSEDHLEPAVSFATSFHGGGGHVNAAAATIDIDELKTILKG